MELETIIGLEIHAQMNSKTKLFCSCDNDSFGKEANTNTCPICMAFPGALPVPNKTAIEKALIAALALNCTLKPHAKFDRKNYFYPDLPSGYQISQFDEPVSEHGHLEIEIDGRKKRVGITRLHVENDAGKLTHTGESTLLDFNRAGTPLMEIVSEPDMSSPEEAVAYAELVQKILRATGSSDCDMEKGMMRFDASVSLRPIGETKLYPRAEIKNLNSFRSLLAAIEYEVRRQKKMWESGEHLQREQTVGWDDERGTTELLRDKESAADYRYFPEPDLPPLIVTETEIEELRKKVPELPHHKKERFLRDYPLQAAEAEFFVNEPALANFYEEVAQNSDAKIASSFVATIFWSQLKERNETLETTPVKAADLAKLIRLVQAGTVSNNTAKSTVLSFMLETGDDPEVIIERENLGQVSDMSAIENICKEVIAANPKIVADVQGGQVKAMGALVGQVMKASQGKANPQIVNGLLEKLLLK